MNNAVWVLQKLAGQIYTLFFDPGLQVA